MIVRPATAEEIPIYRSFGEAAQAWLRRLGAEQYVPAAHDAYTEVIAARVRLGTLFVCLDDDLPCAFFSLEETPSIWWPKDDSAALYLGGMVVDGRLRGRRIGTGIIEWCVEEALRRGRTCVRLDCHAGNLWLCGYYEAHGFRCRATVEQHPGYWGRLYEREVAASPPSPADRVS